MTTALQINTAPVAATRAADRTLDLVVSRHPKQDSSLSVAAARRLDQRRPVRMRSVVASLALGVLIGSMAWMHADAAGASSVTVEDAKTDATAFVVASLD